MWAGLPAVRRDEGFCGVHPASTPLRLVCDNAGADLTERARPHPVRRSSRRECAVHGQICAGTATSTVNASDRPVPHARRPAAVPRPASAGREPRRPSTFAPAGRSQRADRNSDLPRPPPEQGSTAAHKERGPAFLSSPALGVSRRTDKTPLNLSSSRHNSGFTPTGSPTDD
jgi:hypothetical protein